MRRGLRGSMDFTPVQTFLQVPADATDVGLQDRQRVARQAFTLRESA